ncbi:hypothetical protein U6A24_08500 [Aquimarina gracilis]|uniref:Lipoprotein n=1 Tax=Aquimarina gracilis TaxID=874422 RepID=A0ABU5ZTV6_9FLAO|nr:hypothetical protein [Aquimarina gracilis]MEB3345495.1 hypothetical protein [Aquimarina gracilis]
MRIHKEIIKILTIAIIFTSCSTSDKEKDKHGLSTDFSKIINDYVNKNPLKLPIKGKLYENGFSYPSYQVYFDIKDNDSIISIIQVAHFNDTKPYNYKVNKGETTYEVTKAKGSFLYEDKYPITIFDENSLGQRFYSEKLLLKVPDSLKFNKHNYHIKPNKQDYKIKQGLITN